MFNVTIQIFHWLSTHLLRPTGLDEVLIDLPGLVSHLHGAVGLLEVLTSNPELNVLLTKLGPQEASEHGHTTCGGKSTIVWKEKTKNSPRHSIASVSLIYYSYYVACFELF